MPFFQYTRFELEPKKGEDGNNIPILEVKNEGEEPTPTGKFEEEKVPYKDFFNINNVIRTHTYTDGSVIVLLNDGHEITEKHPVLKNKNHKGPVKPGDVIEEKQRTWVQSQILLENKDDIARFEEFLLKA